MTQAGLIRTHLVRRSLAAFLDYGLLFLPVVFTVKRYGTVTEDGSQVISGLPGFALIVSPLLVLAGLEAAFGRTGGKWFFDLRVVTRQGQPPSLVQCLKRRCLDPFDFFMCVAPAVLLVRLTPTNQRLGDLWAGTWVVGTEHASPFRSGAA